MKPTTDYSADHRENIVRNLARVEAHLQVAQHHQRQIRAGLVRERDYVQRDLEYHARLLIDPRNGAWTAEDRADYEAKLARRHKLDTLLANDETTTRG